MSATNDSHYPNSAAAGDAEQIDEQAHELRRIFQERFASEPLFVARAPGRVNLIGEHIDYHGYSVLPMAIRQNIRMAISIDPDSSKLRLSNVDKDKYGDYEGSVLQLFELKKRIRHIFSEADRVKLFKDICEKGPCKSGSEDSSCDSISKKLGTLMNDSHISCRDDYECSCGDLDELVLAMQHCGAYGARLTGAGWGGCAVAMIPKGIEDTFLSKVTTEFFAKDPKRSDRLPEALFITTPAEGAKVTF